MEDAPLHRFVHALAILALAFQGIVSVAAFTGTAYILATCDPHQGGCDSVIFPLLPYFLLEVPLLPLTVMSALHLWSERKQW